MEFKIEQIQTQKLALTPELLQSIKILQCTTVELNDLIGEQLLSNPMLELSENQPEYTPQNNNKEIYDYIEHSYYNHNNNSYYNSESDELSLEQITKAEWTLSDFLYMQLSLIKIDPDLNEIAEYIIGTINEFGYRTERATSIAYRFDISRDRVIEAINIIQSLEPAGIGAKSIPECLKLQLMRTNEYDEIYEHILFEHLDDLAANKINTIAKSLNLSIEKVLQYINKIKKLNPKPGINYGKVSNNRYIIPDLELRYIDEKAIILQNDRSIVSVCASPYYKKMLLEAKDDKETIDYLHKKMDAAINLIKGIDQRKQTILKVAEVIISKQSEFFTYGNFALKPMTLADIAEEVGIHESTVSRAINGKYIQTPRGLFELKYFFSSGISSITGSDLSSEAVKKQIQDIISFENPRKPYSDEKIKSLLFSNYGTEIARRTISKYREQLGIAGSSIRKKY